MVSETFSKSDIITFVNQTSEIKILGSRKRTEMFLYSKQNYEKQFSKEFGPSLTE